MVSWLDEKIFRVMMMTRRRNLTSVMIEVWNIHNKTLKYKKSDIDQNNHDED